MNASWNRDPRSQARQHPKVPHDQWLVGASSGDFDPVACRILEHYELPALAGVRGLGSAGGFSGAQFWQVHAAEATLCLRRWPQTHPDADRLNWIHAVLRHVAAAGGPPLPLPLLTRNGGSFVSSEGHLWELTPWLPGRPDYRQAPSTARLTAALEALAQFHRSAATFPTIYPAVPGGAVSGGDVSGFNVPLHLPRALDPAASRLHQPGQPPPAEVRGPSPGLRQRLGLLRRWLDGDLDRLAGCLSGAPAGPPATADSAAIRELGFRIIELSWQLGPRLYPRLAAACTWSVPLQPCIRDIWRDNVLFDGDRVRGLIDFGAMRTDSVCGDVARLLGSLAGDDATSWERGLDGYQRVRPISDTERTLVEVFDHSGVMLGGLNWLQWTFREGRRFDWPRVVERLEETVRRLLHQTTRRPELR